MAGITRDAAGREVYGEDLGPVAGKQEVINLVTANSVASPSTVYGGDYVFSQLASGYGTLTLQVLGPDNQTWQTIVSKTASDTASGTGVALGSNSTVRSTTSGTTGAYATLSRVPE